MARRPLFSRRPGHRNQIIRLTSISASYYVGIETQIGRLQSFYPTAGILNVETAAATFSTLRIEYDNAFVYILFVHCVILMFSFLLLYGQVVCSLPLEPGLGGTFTNHTTLWEVVPGWFDGPTYRGTSDILWSCVATIFACIYTSIHLNTPPKHISKWKRIVAKVRWAFTALIFPELVLQAALAQRQEARLLVNDLRKIVARDTGNESQDTPTDSVKQDGHGGIPQSCPPSKAPAQQYTMAYGYWVVMGGFVLDTDDIHGDVSRVAVTGAGALLLAEHGHFLDVSRHQIADRSKANQFGKLLVCFQVTWMLLQCFVRLAAGYPLTLLEIHTMTHVLCALFIYIVWWDKPLDVEEPIVVASDKFKDLLAFMIMASAPTEDAVWNLSKPWPSGTLKRSSKLPFNGDLPFHQHIPGLSFFAHTKTKPDKLFEDQLFRSDSELSVLIFDTEKLLPHKKRSHSTVAICSCAAEDVEVIDEDNILSGNAGAMLDVGCLKSSNATSSVETTQASPNVIEFDTYVSCGFAIDADIKLDILEKTLQRWNRCAQVLPELNLSELITKERYVRGSEVFTRSCNKYVNTRHTSGTIIRQALDDSSKMIWLYLALMWLPVIYGAIHLTAWNLAFPTATEALIWKIACIGIMAGLPTLVGIPAIFGFLILLVLFLKSKLTHFVSVLRGRQPSQAELETDIQHWSDIINMSTYVKADTGTVRKAVYFSIVGAVTLLISYPSIIIIIFSRFYLVVESFISLRAIPVGALTTVSWLQAIPHI